MSLVENLDIRYPEALVNRYGAKAGLLMHAAKHRPDIPQMPMVVSKLGEPPKEFLARVDQAGIPWPRIFRSSAVAELIGFEGVFPTHTVDTFLGKDKVSRYFIVDGGFGLLCNDEEFSQMLEDLVREIAYSPRKMTQYQLPPEINVIAVGLASCEYTGVLIKHPNRPDFYLTTLTESKNRNNMLTLEYNPVRKFSTFGNIVRNTIRLNDDVPKSELETVIGWHDTIAKLLDPRWVYVIEYGLMPATLFQVHYFKPIQRACFEFNVQQGEPLMPIVIGVTDENGEDYEVVFNSTKELNTDIPLLYVDNLHSFVLGKGRFDNRIKKELQGYVFEDAGGILVHKDIKALRESKLALIYPEYGSSGLNREGMIVNVVSNGRSVRITDKLTGEEIF